MRGVVFWLRWAARELRARKLQVIGLALVIGIGVGVYSGFSTMNSWRRISYEDSFEGLHAHDLEVRLSDDSFLPAGRLVEVVASAGGDRVAASQERLVVPTQVELTDVDEPILVPGRLVSVDVAGDEVDTLQAEQGRALDESDQAAPVANLGLLFADGNDVPDETRLVVSGGRELDVVGHVHHPEYFTIITEGLSFGLGTSYGIVFAPLETVQRTTGHEREVNGIVLRASDDVDVDRLQGDLEDALEAAFPDVDTTVSPITDEPYYKLLFDDIEGDQQFYNAFAFLVLVGAGVGAFNLTRRMVEAQRRQIGAAMALGVPPAKIALRPFLMGALIAVLGILIGLVVGLLISAAMTNFLYSVQPLPVERSGIIPSVFLQGAALGLLIPILAVAWPIWRAVRLQPVDALAPPHLSAATRRPRAVRAVGRERGSIGHLPARNLFRHPTRTILSLVAIAAVLAVLTVMTGILQSFNATIDNTATSKLATSPERVFVEFEAPQLEADPAGAVAAVAAVDEVAAVQPGLRLPGRLRGTDDDFEVLLDVLYDGNVWEPTIEQGEQAGIDGIVISRKAAGDLGVDVGGAVTVEHPVRTGPASFAMEASEFTVSGIHDGPLRTVVYLGPDSTERMNLEGVANFSLANPAEGSDGADLERAIFGIPGVASVVAERAETDLVREQISSFSGIFLMIQFVALGLAFLIAVNGTAINMDERTREHATMFAFGLPVRTVLRLSMTENAVLGFLGTVGGLLLGYALLAYFVNNQVNQLLPDLYFPVSFSPASIIGVLLAGTVVIGLAPLLSTRRLQKLDLTSTLRVVE